MPVDVIIDPSTGQIYWNDNAGSGSTQSIAISGNANDSINFVGYSNFFTAGGAGVGTRILATFNDAITSTFVPGTNAYDLGSSSLRWNFYGTGGNFTGAISTSSTTDSTSSTSGALTVSGGAGIAKTSYFGQDVKIQGSTASTTPTTGALVVTGGVGIGGSLNVGIASTFFITGSSIAGFAGSRIGVYVDIQNTSTDDFAAAGLRLANNLYNNAGIFYFSSTTSPGFTQALYISNSFGDTILQAGTGKAVYLRIGSNDLLTLNSTRVSIAQTTTSTSSTTGALTVTGGAGIAKTSYFGQSVVIQGSTASGSTTTGALTVTGGVGIGGSLNVFGTIDVSDNIEVLSQKEVRLFNSANTFYTGLRAGSSSANVTFTLPIADGTANQVLYTNGSAGLAWTSIASVSAITSLNGLTASTQTFATGTSGTDFNISSSTSTHTFNIPYASSGATGLVTTQAQTIAGSKTFSSQTIISDTTASTTTGTGALLVYGGLGVTGQINSASLVTSGNAVISGNLTFNGVGVFGNATTDTINSLARYISDILPSTDNSYDLGNNSLGWRNFRVSGVGTIATLQVTSVASGVWSGTAISASNGGTGRATLTASSVLLGNGTSAVGMTTGSSAQVLVWQSSGDPAFVSLSGDLTITAAGVASIAANSVALGTDTTGQYASTLAISGSGITATTSAGDDGTAYTIYSSATSSNTASAIVLRDGSGNFSAGTITGSLTGTASIATSSVNSATTTDTTSTLYLLGSRSSTGFAGTALYVDSSISILGSQVTAGVWAGTAISAVNGGTGQVSYTVGDLLYASSTTALSKLSAGTAGSVLKSNGAGAAPSWQVATSGGSPGGSNYQIQYNNASSFGGVPYLLYNAGLANEIIISSPYQTTVNASLNIGLGTTSFDGVTLGKFAGSANGTVFAINQASGFTGNFADFQLNGSSKFTIGYDGKITVVGVFSLPTTAGTAGSVLKSNGTGNQLYWAADATGAGGAGTVGSPSTSGLVAYYAGTGASVTSNSRVLIDSANSTVEITSQNSKSALILNAANGSVSNLAEFKNSFGDLFWAFGASAQTLNATNGGALQIDSSSSIILTSPAPVLFYNTAQTFYTAITGSTTTSANVTFTLPSVAGTAGSVLTTAGSSGQLYWSAAASGSGTITSGTANNMAYYTGTTTVDDATNFTYTTAGNGATMRFFGGASVGNTIFIVSAPTSTSIRVGIGTNNPQYELEIVGELSATNKSFVIDHPTKPGKKLRYGSLEGPENGVYVRGELKDSKIIETPDHWEGLVYPDSFTVTLTPIGRFSHLYVEKIEDYKVFIADAYMNPIHCYYTVWAERKDIPKLITEY